MTFEKSGRVYGHIAPWGTCHVGFMNGALKECVQAPRSESNYAHFNRWPLETAEGQDVHVGKLTYDTNHAPISVGFQAAANHYDNTGSVGAFVRARDGQHGIWASGAVKSDLSPEGFRDLRVNGPSGDWRTPQGRSGLELVAALAVVVQGFPIVKPQLALSASAAGDTEVVSLILPPWMGYEEEENALLASAEYQSEKRKLLAEVMPSRFTREHRRRIHSLTRG